MLYDVISLAVEPHHGVALQYMIENHEDVLAFECVWFDWRQRASEGLGVQRRPLLVAWNETTHEVGCYFC